MKLGMSEQKGHQALESNHCMDGGNGNSTCKIAKDIITFTFPGDSHSNCPSGLGGGGLLSSWLLYPSTK